MNIFFREIRANFKSLLIWSVIVVLFVFVGFSKFTAYYNNPEMVAILDTLPPGVVSAFGLNAFNLTTVTGFYGVMIVYFALILSIAAALWGSDIISKEERDKTVEFSLTLPVTRSRLITAKIAVVVVNCIVLLLITGATTVASAARYQPDSEFFNYVSISMWAFFILQMIFLAVGVFLGCALKQYKRASSLVVTVLLVSYFLSILTDFSKNLDFLKYFTPFKYYNAVALLHESKIEPTFILISIGIIAVCLVGAYVTYAKRDLYI